MLEQKTQYCYIHQFNLVDNRVMRQELPPILPFHADFGSHLHRGSFVRRQHIGGIIYRLMYLTVMGIMVSKHRYFSTFWTVIQWPDCFVWLCLALVIVFCSISVLYVYMCVCGCASYCMRVPSGREERLSQLFRGNKLIINQSSIIIRTVSIDFLIACSL